MEDFEGTDIDNANVVLFAIEEKKEIEGKITHLYEDYGLIDNNIVFKLDCYSGIETAKVGDEIVALCSKKHRNEMWKALRVFKRKTCWDQSSDESEVEDDENLWKDKRRERFENLMMLKEKLKAKKNEEIKEMEALLKEKLGVEVEGGDYGKLNLGDCKLLKIIVRNNGSEAQLLEHIKLSKKANQFEITVFNLDSLDTKNQSRKFQESLPIVLSPSSALHVSVLCNGEYIGRDSQFIIFQFENFKIGRELVVEVVRDTSLLLAQDSTNKNDCGRDYMMYNSEDKVLLPAPKYSYYNAKEEGNKIPVGRAPHIRMPHYTIPPSLIRVVDEGCYDTSLIPCLQKGLNINTYKARFQALLHLEELSQTLSLRSYNMSSVTMKKKDKYLFLKVPGLAEGRPSIILGDIVRVVEESCSDGGFSHRPVYEGSVQEVCLEGVYLLFSSEFHQKFLENLTYQVSFTLNRGVMRRCHLAVVTVPLTKHQVLFPKYIEMRKPQFDMKTCTTNEKYLQTINFINPSLNRRQRLAVARVLHARARPLPYIIYGPPGTGKTVTMVEAILQTMWRGGVPILVCAPSNSATDLLAERLYKSGMISKNSIVRLYAFSRSDESRLESLAPISASMSNDFQLQSKKIVVCTCITAAGMYRLNKREFDRKKVRGSWAPKAGSAETMMKFRHVFIDEAGQAHEPECIIPVGLAEDDGQVVLAGDPEQLGPVLSCAEANECGLGVSFLERIFQFPLYQRDVDKFAEHGGYNPLLLTKLIDNYRSHPAIITLSSNMFYHGELRSKADKEMIECLSKWHLLGNKNQFPMLFHGVRGEDLREGNSPSSFNPQEVLVVADYLVNLLESKKSYALSPDDIGIITPYRKQVQKIVLMISSMNLKVKVGSVEEFQGQEKMAVIISTVKSSESCSENDLSFVMGFLSKPKRFNVAITRAHALLIVVGNPFVLRQDVHWRRLLKYCVMNDAYVGCGLPDLDDEDDDDAFFNSLVSPNQPDPCESHQNGGDDEVENGDGGSKVKKGDSSEGNMYDVVNNENFGRFDSDGKVGGVETGGAGQFTSFTEGEDGMVKDGGNVGGLEGADDWDDNDENEGNIRVDDLRTPTNANNVNGVIEIGRGDNVGRHGRSYAKNNDVAVEGGVNTDETGGDKYEMTHRGLSGNHAKNVLDELIGNHEENLKDEWSGMVDEFINSDYTRSRNNEETVEERITKLNCGVVGADDVERKVGAIGKDGFVEDLGNNRKSSIHCASKELEETNNNDKNNNKRNKKKGDVSTEDTDVKFSIGMANDKSVSAVNTYDFRNFTKKGVSLSRTEDSKGGGDAGGRSCVQVFNSDNSKIFKLDGVKVGSSSGGGGKVFKIGGGGSGKNMKSIGAKEIDQLETKSQQPVVHGGAEHASDEGQAISLGSRQLSKKIIKQFEYYFGDFNLIKDPHLNNLTDQDGWVQIEEIMRFKKMRSLKVEQEEILKVLDERCNFLLVDKEGGRVKRKNVFNPDLSLWFRKMTPKTVVVYGMRGTGDEVREVFEQFGETIHVESNIPCRRCNHQEDQCCMIVFRSSSYAAKSTILNRKRIDQSPASDHSDLLSDPETKIAVFYNDKAVTEALYYFIYLRVHQLPRKNLKPIILLGVEELPSNKQNPKTLNNNPDEGFSKFLE